MHISLLFGVLPHKLQPPQPPQVLISGFQHSDISQVMSGFLLLVLWSRNCPQGESCNSQKVYLIGFLPFFLPFFSRAAWLAGS